MGVELCTDANLVGRLHELLRGLLNVGSVVMQCRSCQWWRVRKKKKKKKKNQRACVGCAQEQKGTKVEQRNGLRIVGQGLDFVWPAGKKIWPKRHLTRTGFCVRSVEEMKLNRTFSNQEQAEEAGGEQQEGLQDGHPCS